MLSLHTVAEAQRNLRLWASKVALADESKRCLAISNSLVADKKLLIAIWITVSFLEIPPAPAQETIPFLTD